MEGPGYTDHRPPLTFARETWDGLDEHGRLSLIREAAKAGLRLVIVGRDGETWEASADPAEW